MSAGEEGKGRVGSEAGGGGGRVGGAEDWAFRCRRKRKRELGEKEKWYRRCFRREGEEEEVMKEEEEEEWEIV